MLAGRSYVMPEDVQAVFPAVAAHRIQVQHGANGEVLAAKLLAEVSVRA